MRGWLNVAWLMAASLRFASLTSLRTEIGSGSLVDASSSSVRGQPNISWGWKFVWASRCLRIVWAWGEDGEERFKRVDVNVGGRGEVELRLRIVDFMSRVLSVSVSVSVSGSVSVASNSPDTDIDPDPDSNSDATSASMK